MEDALDVQLEVINRELIARSGADIVLGCLRYAIQGIGYIARRKGSCR